jgi:hypothetical protein
MTPTPITDGYPDRPECPLGYRPVALCRFLETRLNEAEEERLALIEEVAELRMANRRFQRGLPASREIKVNSISEFFGELFAS